MATMKNSDDSKVFEESLYPLVEKSLKTNANNLVRYIGRFIERRHDEIYAIAPYDRIFYGQSDVDEFFRSINIKEGEVKQIMRNCFFYDIKYNPTCAKEAYIETLLMCIRYFLKHNDRKKAEITTIYLCFTGKIYASTHAFLWPKVAPRKYKAVMDYVVNNMLTDKYDLKKEGSVFGAVRKLSMTWLDTYEDRLKKPNSDDECGKHIQQIKERIRSFLYNIKVLYMEAYENRLYLNYETDSLDEDDFHLTDNDSAYAARITEGTMDWLTSKSVSVDICDRCQDNLVRSPEIRDIIESILGDPDNLDDIRRVVNIIICDYLSNNKGGNINSPKFITYSLKPKPNSHNPIIIEQKKIIISWLDENSPQYRKRKTRKATAMSYFKAILKYFVFVITIVADRQ